MKKILFLHIIALLVILTSCEDVIDIQLMNSPSRLVIEAVLTDDSTHCLASISQSEDFYNSTGFKPITGASIKISDDLHNEYILKQNDDGTYFTKEITGKENTGYSIQIVNGNQVYKAYSRMPTKVTLDSLETEWSENPHGKGYVIQVNFKDPKEEKNFYRFKIHKNGKYEKDNNEIIVWDDKVFDGKEVRLPVRRGGNFFQSGDTVRIDMYSIDEKVYNYFLTLKNAVAKGTSMMTIGKSMMEGSSAPANPISNIDNDALGYFGAMAVSSKTIIIGK